MLTEVRERPILFSGPMVQAILAGRKTQTRRVIKEQAPADILSAARWVDGMWRIDHEPLPNMLPDGRLAGNRVGVRVRCPYGEPGDRLWVREAWGKREYREFDPSGAFSAETGEFEVVYRADGSGQPSDRRWRSSIHMPRWASRITLEITRVNVERLHSISRPDAIAEGLIPTVGPNRTPMWEYLPGQGGQFADPEVAYRFLWDRINGKGSWNLNPWVWVVFFKRLEATC